MPVAADTERHVDAELIDLDTVRARRRPTSRTRYADIESCAAMIIACSAAAGGASADIVSASSTVMEGLVDGLRNHAEHRTPFTIYLELADGTVTIGVDDAAVVRATAETAVIRLATVTFRAVLDQWIDERHRDSGSA